MSQHRTVESEVDDMVLTYDDYIKFKEKFDPKNTISLEDVKLDYILDKAEITGDDRTNYNNAFDKLLKLIHRDGLFIYGDNPGACKYINYILYKEVEVEHEIKRSYDEKLISLFHEFLDAYGVIRGKQKRCISNIYNIQSETYNKIKALYEVYDKFKECSGFRGGTLTLGCPYFKTFFDKYNNYMFVNESKSPKFNEILKNIENHAKDTFAKYIIACDRDNYYIRSPRLFKDVTVKKPETHSQEQIHQTGLHSADNRSQYETHGTTHTQDTQLPKVISISQPEHENKRTDEGSSANVMDSESDVHNEILSYPGSSNLERIRPSIGEDVEEAQVFSRFTNPFRATHPTGTTLYSGNDGHEREQAFSNEVPGASTSVMSTITNALRDVDPVPVVGVSGGMGALFLLFRYTPVGAFFRGGRGRVHRIPRSFNGPFPGGFPGYEDYDGGYIGYSPMSMNPLAE
ncbi:VIR protein [Plasmodium vivax]|uniref:VIR protein n=1 Tax=Plasmodium vivax TaxID=5855 RepID=A0A1G4E2Y0_PLAVI|nr:VIR protein [Plasmodium vivax]